MSLIGGSEASNIQTKTDEHLFHISRQPGCEHILPEKRTSALCTCNSLTLNIFVV